MNAAFVGDVHDAFGLALPVGVELSPELLPWLLAELHRFFRCSVATQDALWWIDRLGASEILWRLHFGRSFEGGFLFLVVGEKVGG